MARNREDSTAAALVSMLAACATSFFVKLWRGRFFPVMKCAGLEPGAAPGVMGTGSATASRRSRGVNCCGCCKAAAPVARTLTRALSGPDSLAARTACAAPGRLCVVACCAAAPAVGTAVVAMGTSESGLLSTSLSLPDGGRRGAVGRAVVASSVATPAMVSAKALGWVGWVGCVGWGLFRSRDRLHLAHPNGIRRSDDRGCWDYGAWPRKWGCRGGWLNKLSLNGSALGSQ